MTETEKEKQRQINKFCSKIVGMSVLKMDKVDNMFQSCGTHRSSHAHSHKKKHDGHGDEVGHVHKDDPAEEIMQLMQEKIT